MSFFGNVLTFLSRPVGNNLQNNPQDVRETKKRLNRLGYFDDEVENDFITRELDSSIKNYQTDNNLRVDGKLMPGGETEKGLGLHTMEGNVYDYYSNPNGVVESGPRTLELRPEESPYDEEDNSDDIIGMEPFRQPEDNFDDIMPEEDRDIESEITDEDAENEEEDSSEDDRDEGKEDTKDTLPKVNREAIMRKVQEDIQREKQERDDAIRLLQDKQKAAEGFSAGGFGQLPVNVDATGRMIRDNNSTPPLPERKPEVDVEARKNAILDKSLNDKNQVDFTVVSNPNADSGKPSHTLDYFSEVKANEKTIDVEAKKAGIDPDLVKAIVHLETTQGYYDRIALGNESSIRPMNVRAEYWKDLGYSRKDLKTPEKNIRAGVELLKRIEKQMPDASIAKKATIYNNLGARKVSDYGARIELLTKEKPWAKK